MKRFTILLALLASAAVLFAAGCGDDDDSSSEESTTTALTEQEFLAQANQICAKGNKELDQAANEQFSNGERPTAADMKQFATESLVPSVQQQIDDIRALGIPDELSADVEGALSDAESVLAEIEDDPSALQGDPFKDVNTELRAAGLTTCGSD